MPVFAMIGAYLHGFIRDLLPGNRLPDAIINRDRRSRRMLRNIAKAIPALCRISRNAASDHCRDQKGRAA